MVRVPFRTCRGCAPTLFLVRAIVYALYTTPDSSPAVLRPRAADTPAMQRRHLADATVPPAARSPVPTLCPVPLPQVAEGGLEDASEPSVSLTYSQPTLGIRIWIFLGDAHKWNIIEYPRIFNEIPFIGSRIFHFSAKSEYNIVFYSSLRVFPT